jgi:hypothetical protein
MDRERPQAELDSFIGQVRAVNAAAEADDAIVRLTTPGLLDLGYGGFDSPARA